MTRRVLVTGGSGFIGTNLVGHHLQLGDRVHSIDLASPRNPAHTDLWHEVDLLDRAALEDAVAGIDPTHVLHFAARTDLDGRGLDDYRVNVEGTRNLLDALLPATGVERVIVASSMLVCRNGYTPVSETDYCPVTPYGESKQAMEVELRARPAAPKPWVLVRPTSIWGPWFGEPYRAFFETVLAGRYAHPGRASVSKALGYVGNLVAQVEALLVDPLGRYDGGVVYLTDHPQYTIDEWADTIADAAGRRRPPHVPLALVRAAALAGDVARRVGLVSRPPMTRFRLANMLTSSCFDTSGLAEITGPLPHSMPEGVAATLRWLRDERPDRGRLMSG